MDIRIASQGNVRKRQKAWQETNGGNRLRSCINEWKSFQEFFLQHWEEGLEEVHHREGFFKDQHFSSFQVSTLNIEHAFSFWAFRELSFLHFAHNLAALHDAMPMRDLWAEHHPYPVPPWLIKGKLWCEGVIAQSALWHKEDHTEE